MKKLYFFIFMIVLGLSQINAVNANAYTLPISKVVAPPAAQTITFPAFTSAQTFGAADITLTATASSTLAITYTSSNTNVATIVAGKIHIVGIGSALITAFQPGDNVNWAAATPVSLPLTVTPTLTFANLGSVPFSGTDIALTATSNFPVGTTPITYTTSDPTIATIVSGKLHCVNTSTNTVTITATQQGSVYPGVSYTAATKTATVTITAGTVTPTITWAGSVGTALQSPDIALAATTNNPNIAQFPIIYTITPANPTVATIVNNRLHMVGTGTVTIIATEPGNGKLPDAVPVSASYVITPPVAPTLGAIASKALGTVDFDPAATAATNGWTSTIFYTTTSSNISIVNNKVHLISVGTAIPITANISYPVGSNGTGTGIASSAVNTSLAITAAATVTSPVLTFASPGSKAFTNVDFPLTATSTSQSSTPITFTSSNPAVATIVNNNIHYVGYGTSTITASQGGSAYIAGAIPAPVPQTLTVTPPTITLTNPGTKLANVADFAPAATGTLANIPISYSITPSNVAVMLNGNIHLTGGLGNAILTATQGNTLLSLNGGSGYTNGTYTAVALTGGTGTGAIATVVVAGGSVVSVTITTAGSNYRVNDVLSALNTAIGGTGSGFSVSGIFTLTGGSAYTNGTYTNVPLTGGSGTGAQATIVVAGGLVTTVTVTNMGSGYKFNDVLSAASSSIGGTGTGFSIFGLSVLPLAPDVTATFAVNAATVTNPSITYAALGSKPYGPDFTVAATSTVTTVPITYTSSNPAVATVNSAGLIHMVAALPAPNNFTVITASQGGGSGGAPGLPADVLNTFVVTPALITFPTLGTKAFITTDLAPGATSTNTAAAIAYTSSNPAVATIVAGNIHFVGAGTTTITATQGGGVNGTTTLAPDVSQVLTVTAPVITFPALGTKQFTSTDINPGATAPYLSINSIAATTLTAGSGYVTGTYFNVPLTGGTGTGATANITVINGLVTSAVIVNAGTGYTTTNALTCANTFLGGTGSGFVLTVSGVSADLPITYTSSNPAVATIVNGFIHFTGAPAAPNNTTTITASQGAGLNGYITGVTGTVTGSGYTNGTYTAIPLTGGLGTGATATVVIAAGSVSSVTIVNGGSGYKAADVLSVAAASVGGTGTGFSTTVASTVVSNTIPLPAPVSQTLTVTPPTINFNALGTKAYSTTDLNPGATSSITNVPINYTSNITSVATINNSGISNTNRLNSGAQYTPGTYTNVPLTGGTGTGATATIVVGPVNSNPQTINGITTINTINGVESVTLQSTGSGYTVGDVLTVDPANLGTSVIPTPPLNFKAFSVTVSGVSSFIHYVGAGTTNITASQGGGVAGTLTLPADVTVPLTVAAPAITFPALGTQNLPVADFAPGATSTLSGSPIAYTSSTAAVATILPNSILQLAGTANNGTNGFFAGQNYPNGAYFNVPLTGGTGTGATANITIIGGSVTGATIVSGGTGYTVGDNLTTNNINLGGSGLGFSISPIVVGGAIHVVGSGTTTIKATQGGGATGLTSGIIGYTVANGSGYTNGFYPAVALTNVTGTGTGVTANIFVSGGKVISVVLTGAGTGYIAGNTLTCPAASIGGGSGTGFGITVTAIGPVAADASTTLTVSPFTLALPTLGTKLLTDIDYVPNAVSTNTTAPIVYTSSNPAVATIVNGNIHYIAPGNTTIEATQQNSPVGTVAPATSTLPGDITSALTVASPVITFTPQFGAKSTLSTDFAPGATSTLTNTPITYTSSNTAVATILSGSVIAGTVTPGVNYLPGRYLNVPLTGGTGTGAQAIIVTAGGGVSSITLVSGGTGYVNGDVLSATPASLGGIGTGFKYTVSNAGPVIHPVSGGSLTVTASQGGGNLNLVGGTSYTNGTYNGVALTGGSGTGATANIIVSGGAVTSVVVTSPGTGYKVADVLSAANTSIGGTGTGFSIGGLVVLPLPADVVSPTFTIAVPTITFPALGTKSYTNVDFMPGATSPIATRISYTSNNTAVATIVNTLTLNSSINIGSGYVNGTYYSVPLTGGTGTGATATIVVANNSVSSVTVTGNGSNYVAGDVLSVASLGGSGLGFSATVVGYVSYIHIVANAAGTATITASQGGGATGTTSIPADVQNVLTVTPVTITFPPFGSVVYSNTDINPGATSTVNLPITYTSGDATVATITGTGQVHMLKAGTVSIKASQGGGGTGLNGFITGISTLTGGTAYTNGTYTLVPLTGGAGAGAQATIVVNGNSVTAITITNGGSGYATGNALSCAAASIGGTGSGFSTTVSTVTAIPADVSSSLTITGGPAITFAALGTKVYTSTDLVPGATSTLNTVPITYTSSNTAIASIVNGNIHFNGVGGPITITASQGGGLTGLANAIVNLTNIIGGSAYTNGTYNAVPLTGGSGTGALATVVVAGGSVTSVTVTTRGSGYTSGNTLSCAAASIGGTGTGFTVTVAGIITLPADVTPANTLTVSAPTITFTAAQLPATKAIQSVDLAPGATSTVTTVPITYTSSDPTIATIVNGNIHFVGGIGSVVIRATQQNTLATAALATTVNNAIVSFTQVNGSGYTNGTYTSVALTGGAGTGAQATIVVSGGAVSAVTLTNRGINYAVNDVLTCPAANIGGTGAGFSITLTSLTSLPADVQLTLGVTVPTITFTTTQIPVAAQPFSTIDRAPGATSTLANVPITYTSSDPNVATIVNGLIHYVGLGVTTITASQQTTALAAGFIPPADVSLPLTVGAPTLTFTAALGSKVFTSTDLSLLNLVTGTVNQSAPITFTSSDPTVATIVNNQLHYTGIGNCIITATQAPVAGAGVPAVTTSPLTVTPAVITVAPTASLGTLSISTPDAQLAYTSTISTSTFPISYTSSDPTVATITTSGLLHFVAPGTCTIIGNEITGTNYQPLPTFSTLTITALTVPVNGPTITFPALGTKQYSNNGDITPAATSTNGNLAISYTSSNPAVATILNGVIHLTPPSLINGVVTYPIPNTTVITASQGGGTSGTATLAADVSTVLTVTPAGISFPPLGVQKFTTIDLAPGATSSYVILNAANIAQPITYTSSDPSVATIVNGNIHFIGLGTTTITASLGNVIVPDVSQVMTVVAPAITFATTLSRPYSTADVAPGATSTLPTPITYTSSNPSVATIVNGLIHFTGVGVTTITASQAAVGNSTAPLNATQVLTVTPPTITFALTTKAFSLTDIDPGATSTLLTTPITYTSSNPALVSIVNNKLHFNIPASNLTNNTSIITATQVGESNIPVQSVSQTLIVTQAVIVPNALIKAYGDPDFSPAFSTYGTGYPVTYASATTTVATGVTANGIVNSALHIVAPGTSVITYNQAGDGNVAAAPTTGNTVTLTVTQAPMTITPKNVTIAYGTTAVPVLPVNYFGFKSASGGVPLDDSTKFTTQPTVYVAGKALNGNFSTLPVGTYTLTAAGAVSTLYTFTYGTGTLTVTAPLQTLTWAGNNQLPPAQQTPINKTFGDADFDPLARSTGDPIVYTSSDPTVATVTANGFVHIVGAGSATITATLNTSSGNYVNSLTLPNNVPIVLTKTLNVAQGKQIISVAAIPFLIRNAAAYTPNASASSGLPVSVSVTDASYLKIVNGNLLPLHVGVTKVSFTQAGNANYLAADTVNVFVKVVDPAGADLLVHQALSPDGDGINDFLYIEGVASFPVNHVKIIDRNGGNVFETDNYDNKNNVFTGKAKNGNKLPGGTYFFIVDYNVGNQSNHITGYFVLKY